MEVYFSFDCLHYKSCAINHQRVLHWTFAMLDICFFSQGRSLNTGEVLCVPIYFYNFCWEHNYAIHYTQSKLAIVTYICGSQFRNPKSTLLWQVIWWIIHVHVNGNHWLTILQCFLKWISVINWLLNDVNNGNHPNIRAS